MSKTMINRRIAEIFPTPIYRAHLDRSYTQEELDFVKKNEMKCDQNVGNKTSVNKNVLECAALATLKKEILNCIDDYFIHVIGIGGSSNMPLYNHPEKVQKLLPSEQVKPYITQSWFNYAEKGQYHQWHNHSNSYVSGGIYINADKDTDRMQFQDVKFEAIKIVSRQRNKFNSHIHEFAVDTGDIILFPSDILHSVPANVGEHTRISLAFNIFIKGEIGAPILLNELKL